MQPLLSLKLVQIVVILKHTADGRRKYCLPSSLLSVLPPASFVASVIALLPPPSALSTKNFPIRRANPASASRSFCVSSPPVTGHTLPLAASHFSIVSFSNTSPLVLARVGCFMMHPSRAHLNSSGQSAPLRRSCRLLRSAALRCAFRLF